MRRARWRRGLRSTRTGCGRTSTQPAAFSSPTPSRRAWRRRSGARQGMPLSNTPPSRCARAVRPCARCWRTSPRSHKPARARFSTPPAILRRPSMPPRAGPTAPWRRRIGGASVYPLLIGDAMPLIRTNEVELFYDLTGPENAPVVAFSNSIGTTLEMWDRQVPALSDRYRCLRYDPRGHGRSQVLDQPVTIDDLADDLAGLLDALGVETAHIVGLSLGGMTAQAFGVRHPDRAESLTLMATAAYLPHGYDKRAETVRAQGMGVIVDAVLARWFTPDFAAAHPEVITPMRERFLQLDPRGYAVCCMVIHDMDLRASNAAIRAPTLIIAGADDAATPPAMLEDIRTRIPQAELIVLPRAAAIPAVEQAERVTRHLAAFLDGLTGGKASRAGGVSFEAGLANRKSVLGVEHVERSLKNAGAFAMPWQDFITRMAWGEIWSDPTLPRKVRSLVTLSMMVALHREEEFKLHVRPALCNGVTIEELRALLLQTAIYAGVPATNAAFRWVKETLRDEIA